MAASDDELLNELNFDAGENEKIQSKFQYTKKTRKRKAQKTGSGAALKKPSAPGDAAEKDRIESVVKSKSKSNAKSTTTKEGSSSEDS